MRVTSVDLYSANFEEPIRFSLHDTDPTARYQIRTIFGLDAEEIIPKFYGNALVTSSKYFNFSMKPRDIVLRAALSPRFHIDESYSDIRDELYRTISANRTGIVKLYFKSGESIISNIQGSIIKFEVPYFNKLPEVQLTVRCNDPIFRSISPVILTPAQLGTGNIVSVPDSLSTAPHGCIMKVVFTDTAANFGIRDVVNDSYVNPDWKFTIVPNSGFVSGDQLYISTELADKRIYMVHSGVTTQLLDKIVPGSIWPVVFPGQNDFNFTQMGKFNWVSLEYYAAYWGV